MDEETQRTIEDLRTDVEDAEAKLMAAKGVITESKADYWKGIARILAQNVRYEMIEPDDLNDVHAYKARCPICGALSPAMAECRNHEEDCEVKIAQGS